MACEHKHFHEVKFPRATACASCGLPEVFLLRGAMRADDKRLMAAGEKCGIVAGCDTPDAMADAILSLRAENAQLKSLQAHDALNIATEIGKREAAEKENARLDELLRLERQAYDQTSKELRGSRRQVIRVAGRREGRGVVIKKHLDVTLANGDKIACVEGVGATMRWIQPFVSALKIGQTITIIAVRPWPSNALGYEYEGDGQEKGVE